MTRWFSGPVLILLAAALAAPAVLAQPQGKESEKEQAPASKPKMEMPEWVKHANEAYGFLQAKKYKEAAAAYEIVMADKELPKQFTTRVQFELATSYAASGEKDKAIALLVTAIDGGMYDFDGIKESEELKSVRDDAKILDAMKRNAEKKAKQDEERKKAEADQMKEMDEEAMKQLPDALTKVADPKGAGFDFAFDLKTLDGKPISSKSIEGKVAIVDIWGTWCPPCRLELPHFVEISKRHAKDAFIMIGMNDEDRKQNADAAKSKEITEKFLKKTPLPYTLALIDHATFKQVPGFEGYPTTLFIDKKGKVRLVEVGYHPLEYLDGVVKALLAEK